MNSPDLLFAKGSRKTWRDAGRFKARHGLMEAEQLHCIVRMLSMKSKKLAF